jgi:hypothetical protein
MRTRNVVGALVVVGLVFGLALAVAAEEAEEVTVEFKGEVLDVDGNTVIVKMLPSGNVRTFDVRPGREFIVDGKTITVADLKPGTVLETKATFVPTTDQVSSISGTVVKVVAMTAVVRLETGEIKSYTVDSDYQFMVDGNPKTIRELQEGTKLTATRITADPATVITPETPITGKAPK